jgi:Arm domain-containing DNA-binding protein/integrase-like protein
MTKPTRRQRRERLTDKQVASLPRRRKRYFHPDPELPGHGVRVLPDGPSSFYVIARDAFRKQRWLRIGGTAELMIEDSREQARAVLKRLKAGLTPFEPPPVQPDTVADVCAGWVKRHVEAKGLRTAGELRRVLDRYVLPRWRDRPFTEIRRSDVAALLDHVEDKHGAWVADQVLAVLGSVSSWYASRNDDYVPPFVKGMRRVPAQARKRSRILSDDELRAVCERPKQPVSSVPSSDCCCSPVSVGSRSRPYGGPTWTAISGPFRRHRARRAPPACCGCRRWP